jgi:hypothetical protein
LQHPEGKQEQADTHSQQWYQAVHAAVGPSIQTSTLQSLAKFKGKNTPVGIGSHTQYPNTAVPPCVSGVLMRESQTDDVKVKRTTVAE